MKVFSPVKRSDFDLSDNLGVQCLADFLGFVEQQSEHQTRGVYLRDDHCDWGSSGMNEFTDEFTQNN